MHVCLFSTLRLNKVATWYIHIHTKSTNLGIFWSALEWKILVCFCTFLYLVNFVIIWYIFHVLVYFTRKTLPTVRLNIIVSVETGEGQMSTNFSLIKNQILRDRCNDFLNIFAEKIGEKNCVFDSKQSSNYAKI
jgi:hypothetical protein